MVGVSILPSGITEKFRVTHIVKPSNLEALWKADCAQYTGNKNALSCRKLLDGSEYCDGASSYVPQYCYAGSTADAYFANQIWNYSSDFINRALYIGNDLYTLGTSAIKRWNIDTPTAPLTSRVFKAKTSSSPIAIPMGAMVK